MSRPETDELARLRKILAHMKNADNWAKYAHITVILNGQPLTTIGNMLADAVGGLDEARRDQAQP